MHCFMLYEILGNPDTNIVCGMNSQQWRETRKLVVGLVLYTDMANHLETVNNAKVIMMM